MQSFRIIIVLLFVSFVLFFPSQLYATCSIQQASLPTRAKRFSRRIQIFAQFHPSIKIDSYFQTIKTKPSSYTEAIQQTHALTLSVTELHKLRQISSSLYQHFADTFQLHLTHLVNLKNQEHTCQSEIDNLIQITKKNHEVAEELLIDRLPRYQMPQADNQHSLNDKL